MPERQGAVAILCGAMRFEVQLRPPSAKDQFFLDPPSGLGQQTPAVASLIAQEPAGIDALLAAAAEHGALLVDHHSETALLGVRRIEREVDLVYLDIEWRDFASWAQAEGALVYDGHEHRWLRH